MKLFPVVCCLLLFACSKPGDPADPDPGPGPGPGPGPDNGNKELTITSVSPESAEAGILVIKGTGFNATASQNLVSIGPHTTVVENATTTQLDITMPASLPQGDHDITIRANSKTVTKTKAFHRIGWLVSNFAGTGVWDQTDGPAATASFRWPSGLIMDNAGNLFVTDLHKIRKITPQGVVSTVAGGNASGFRDGDAANARFNTLNALVMDANRNIYVADEMNHVIRRISATGVVSTVAGKSEEFGYVDGIGTDARFAMPYGLALNAGGTHLYVGDHMNHRIRRIELANSKVTTVAGDGQNAHRDGNGLTAGIPSPGGITFDSDGNLYIAEKGAGYVRKMTPNGDVTTIGGNLSANTAPTNIVIDKDKNTYVAYSGTAKIKKYTPAGVETNFAGNNFGTGEEDGDAQVIFFQRPEGMVLQQDAQGKMTFYVCDALRKKIKKITKE
ncbi:MAG: SMP-30/gluconolactonase/LRE family protein [Candidatus Pseudobacter hemicellulosilyticus]|uniref:SMP-30/gluconolactonase/LRE family protein n=1 Tax=Candidatus Pseudobacter hemicellulosilyticus TaxID=3121375 RepID=A0AAJ6BH98_9BACT|nr:MAG: SMP-30/gluconolactonase/LRE family protein [Pseudobacter sp.]